MKPRRDGSARSREEKAAAGAVLLASERTLSRLRSSAKAASAEARRAEEKPAHLAALVAVGARLAGELSDAVGRGRAEARAAARRRFRAEVEALGSGPAPALSQAAALSEAADAASSRIAADSLVAQWRAVEVAARREGASRRFSELAFAGRAERTASTEVAQAYGDEHRELARDLALRHPELADRFEREWSAYLDACPDCASHDGERAGLEESFSGGDEPGHMHPHCRCTSQIVAAER